MSNYEKEIVNKQNNISGNIKDFNQQIKSVFYKKTKNMPSKMAIYMVWEDNGTNKAIRSTYFSSTKQFKIFLLNMAEALGYFMKKRDKIGDNWNFQAGAIAKEVKEAFVKGVRK